MANTIKLKRGTSTPSTSDIVSGEVAVDTSAKKLYINDSGTIKEIGPAGTTINNNANNRIITGSGTANTLEAESSLTWNGSTMTSSGSFDVSSGAGINLASTNYIVLDSAQMIKLNSEQGTEIQVPSLRIKNQADNETMALFSQNGACSFYYDDSLRIQTTSSGATLTGTYSTNHTSGNIGLDIHGEGSGIGAQTKYRNDHGTCYVGVSGNTTG